MKIVFFGTPDYVLPILDTLHKEFKERSSKSSIVAVVTQAARPAGRKKILTYSPVDAWAHKKKIPVFYNSQDLVEQKVEADLGILAAYGLIVPNNAIKYFPFGILNIHPSLLPKFRGASPIQASIISGDNETGVTIIKLDNKVDHGPIISQFKERVLPTDTTDSLRKRLFKQSAEVLVTLLPAYLKGKITPRKQDHKKATFTTLLKKEYGFIPPKYLDATLQGKSFKGKWKIPFIKDYTLNPTPYTLERFIRAMQPWPISWTYIQLNSKLKAQSSKRLKILRAHLEPNTEHRALNTKQILVLDEVQLEGKNPVSWKQFKQAYPKAKF